MNPRGKAGPLPSHKAMKRRTCSTARCGREGGDGAQGCAVRSAQRQTTRGAAAVMGVLARVTSCCSWAAAARIRGLTFRRRRQVCQLPEGNRSFRNMHAARSGKNHPEGRFLDASRSPGARRDGWLAIKPCGPARAPSSPAARVLGPSRARWAIRQSPIGLADRCLRRGLWRGAERQRARSRTSS